MLAKFVQQSGINQADVLGLPLEDIRNAAADPKVGFSPLDVARLIVEVQRLRPPATDPLVAQFEKQDLWDREEFRRLVDRHDAERKAVSATTHESLARTYLHLAKGKHLTPEEVLNAGYAVFASKDALKLHAHNTLNKSVRDRITSHNFFVAAHLQNSEGFYLNYGKLLPLLPVPLYPAGNDFEILNTTLMKEFSDWSAQQPQGGSASPHSTPFTSSLFRSVGGCVDGGGALQVVADGHGGHVVDITAIETAFDGLYRHVHALGDEVRQHKAAADAGKAASLADSKAIWERMQKSLASAKRDLTATQAKVLQSLGKRKGPGGNRSSRPWGF